MGCIWRSISNNTIDMGLSYGGSSTPQARFTHRVVILSESHEQTFVGVPIIAH